MNKNRIQTIKETFTIIQTAEMLGLEVKEINNTQSILCVNHEERHPSMILMPDVNRVKCMSCGWGGDVINLVEKVKGLTTVEALDFFIPKQKNFNWNDPYTYLQNRGISKQTAAHFGLELRKHFGDKLCQDCGKTGTPTAVAIPIIKSANETRFKFRVINPKSDKNRYFGDKGYGGKLFQTTMPEKGAIILTEGEFDAIVVWQHTQYAAWTVVTGKATDLEKFTEDFEKIEKIYIAYDNDDAGEEGAVKVAETLGVDKCYRLTVPIEYGKDWTDFFLHGGNKQEFDKLIKQARNYNQENLLEEWEKQQLQDTFLVQTGVSYIDDVIGGFRSANAYILGGLEKSGKSSLLMNFLDSMLKNTDHKVGYINTEFTLTDFAIRMAAIHTNLSKDIVESDRKYSKEWLNLFHDKIFYAGIEGKGIKENNLLSFDKTMVRLKEFVRQGMQVLFFDNVTSFATSNSKKANWEVLSSCITELVTFSKAKNIVVIMVLHQKANTVVVESAARIKKMIDEGKPEDIFQNDLVHIRKPTLSDLFGGGTALSQVSGTIFVWRPYQKFNDIELNKQTAILMESFRHSQGGESRVIFDGAIGSFKKVEIPQNSFTTTAFTGTGSDPWDEDKEQEDDQQKFDV